MSQNPDAFFEKVELTEDEIKAAILEGKKRKYFREQHRDYWIEVEKKKVKGKHVTNL